MKIILGFRVHGFILAAAFSAGLGFGAGASAQVPEHSYLIDLNTKTVTQIGALGSHTWASGINEAGQVVGSFETAGGKFHVFITGPDGMGMRDIGTLGGGGYHHALALMTLGRRWVGPTRLGALRVLLSPAPMGRV